MSVAVRPDTRAAEQDTGTYSSRGAPASYHMDPAVAHQIWNYIGMLGVDRETTKDLYSEAQDAIWEADTHRATRDCHAYLVKTGVGAMRHWLRDRYGIIRIPGYLHDRGEASDHMKTIVPLEDITETVGDRFEDGVLEGMEKRVRIEQIIRYFPALTRAERDVMEGLLSGQTVKDIAREREVRVGCVYAQRSKAMAKLKKLAADDAAREEEDAGNGREALYRSRNLQAAT